MGLVTFLAESFLPFQALENLRISLLAERNQESILPTISSMQLAFLGVQ